MKKKWIAVIPAVSLIAAPLSVQPIEAASKNKPNKVVQQSESTIPKGYEKILNWPAQDQPVVRQGSHSFEVEFVQVMLNHFGFNTDVDGVFGPQTEQQVQKLQDKKGLTKDGIVGVNTWIVLLDKYEAELFTVDKAIEYAERALDNDDLLFSSDGVRHKNSDGKVYYILKAQSKELIEDGGSGTVGYYNVYQNGKIVESEPE